MQHIKKKVLFSRDVIEERVRELAGQLSHDYEGKELLLVGILKGAFIFMADLARFLAVPHIVDFVRLASYGSSDQSSGTITITKDLEFSVEGKDVLIIEDIIDSGLTMAFLLERLRERKPRSLKVCALVDKRARRETEVAVDYAGFVMDDGFVVGYGLDFDENFRCEPDIYVIEEFKA